MKYIILIILVSGCNATVPVQSLGDKEFKDAWMNGWDTGYKAKKCYVEYNRATAGR